MKICWRLQHAIILQRSLTATDTQPSLTVWLIFRGWKARGIHVFWKRTKKGICLAELDLKRLREYRRSEVHGNAYRHPEKYAILSEDKVQEPFVRTDRRR